MMKLNLKSKILLIGFVSLLLFLIIMKFGNTSALKGKIGAFKVGAPCDDNNKCTVNDAIRPNGKCEGHIKPPPVKRLKLCKQWSCNASTGEFSEVNQAEGTACNDKNLYTSNDQCVEGTCKGTDIISSLCDPDGDGKITDKFKDANLLKAIREAIGKGETEDITVEDTNNTTELNLLTKNISNISGIECFSNLTDLRLSGNPIKDISPISGLKNLTVLSLASLIGTLPGEFQKDILNLSPLSGLTNLEILNLDSNSISDIKNLAGLTKLTELYLNFNKISDITLLSNLNLKNFQILGISDNEISNINAISGMTNLTELNIDNNNLISDITPLTNMTKLIWLSAHTNLISDITPLGGLTKLNYLKLNGNQIFVIEALVNLTKLTWLNLSNNYISDIAPLINNIGLATGDSVFLSNNTKIPTDQIEELKAKGVMVDEP